MTIRRVHLDFEDHFTQMPNAWVRDTRLSRKARGVLIEILSHREGWELSTEALIAGSTEGRDAIKKAVQELEQHGYLTRERKVDENHRFDGTMFIISDPFAGESAGQTVDGFPGDGKPGAGFPSYGKTATKKTSSSEDQDKNTTRARAVQLPSDFVISDDMRAWAATEAPLVDIDVKLREWMDYWRGVGKPMKDWVAVWRNGMRKQQSFAERDRGKTAGPGDWMNQ
jgi:hypothetical protein